MITCQWFNSFFIMSSPNPLTLSQRPGMYVSGFLTNLTVSQTWSSITLSDSFIWLDYLNACCDYSLFFKSDVLFKLSRGRNFIRLLNTKFSQERLHMHMQLQENINVNLGWIHHPSTMYLAFGEYLKKGEYIFQLLKRPMTPKKENPCSIS